MNARDIGMAVVALGGGRAHADDAIDPSVGLTEMIDVGTQVRSGSTLCVVHAASDDDADAAIENVRQAIRIGTRRRRPAGRDASRRPMSSTSPPTSATASWCCGTSCRPPIVTLCRRAPPSSVEAFDPGPARTIFSTLDQGHASDRYFQESARRIRFFLRRRRPISRCPGAEQDRPCPARPRSGVRPHLAPAEDRGAGRGAGLPPAIAAAVDVPLQAAPYRRRGRLAPGRDLPAHRPSTVTGFWIALDDADRDNGCLMALPGGHRRPLRERFHRGGEAGHRHARSRRPGRTPRVALEAERGTLVVLHGLLPHASAPNRSGRARHAYALHLIDGHAEYSSDNWLQRPDCHTRLRVVPRPNCIAISKARSRRRWRSSWPRNGTSCRPG